MIFMSFLLVLNYVRPKYENITDVTNDTTYVT